MDLSLYGVAYKSRPKKNDGERFQAILAVPVQVNITGTSKCQSRLMTPDFSDLVHCVFSATVRNVPWRTVEV